MFKKQKYMSTNLASLTDTTKAKTLTLRTKHDNRLSTREYANSFSQTIPNYECIQIYTLQ